MEAIAKGAVQFSRKYSFEEIHERWHKLLYDPIVSKDASSSITDFEHSVSPLPSKFFKIGHLKDEQKDVSVKRKVNTVRNSYYAMRKRIRRDMQTSMDYNFLVDSENDNYVVNGNEPLPENVLEGSTSNDFSNHDPSHYGLPENFMDVDIGVAAQAFYTGVDDTLEGNFPMDQNNIAEEEPQILEDNMLLNGTGEEFGDSIELDIEKFIGDDELDDMSFSAFHQINNDPAILCSEFDEDYMFDSPELECGNSFDDLELSLPDIQDMPVWRTEEQDNIPCDGSKDSIACEDGYLEELSNSLLNFTGEEELFLMDSVGKDGIGKSYYDGLSSLLLNPPIDGCSDQIPETAEVELLLTPREDVKNPSVSCRAEVDDNAGKAETELLAAFDAHVKGMSASCRAEVDDNAISQSNGMEVVQKPEFQMAASASAKDPQFPELINGVVLCVTNTEDPEVPSNDDVFLPFNEPPPTISCTSESAAKKPNIPVPSSGNDYGYRASGRSKVLMQVEQKSSVGAQVSSQTTGAHCLPGPVCGSKKKCELSNNHASHTPSRNAIASSDLGGNSDATNKTHAALHASPKEKLVDVNFVKHQSNNVTNLSHKKPVLGNGFRNNGQPNGSSLKQERDVALPVENSQLQHVEMGCADVMGTEPVVYSEKLDEEEQYIESDDEVPYYSDVEAMVRHAVLTFHSTVNFTFCTSFAFFRLIHDSFLQVLDMDLEPDDHDLYDNEEGTTFTITWPRILLVVDWFMPIAIFFNFLFFFSIEKRDN